MIIKRVVIQGFKTYAKKTDFIFDPGVTAVVGPNGSGKSNVADAIRWCLGEQSFSLLRSKKTSDVIFSGSDRKSRLGMAQVSVTLDNTDGELPVDFVEVEITRRAYRDGNNEYLLNGQRVRLQDITEILAPTGLGKRTYALIGQGLIERVLSMTPEELRTLFEEAAGITTQRSKRTTALRRLDVTQQNLTRVKDIIAEISPRLGYLERQAKRAEQRNELAEQLRSLLEDWYGYHWHQALRMLDTKTQEAEELNQLVESHRSTLDLLSQSIETKRSRQSRLRAELSELHRTSSAHHRTAEQIGRDLAVAQERHRQVIARTEAIRQELAPLRLQRETLTVRIAESERKMRDLQSNVEVRKQRIDSLQKLISNRHEERRKVEAEVETQRRRTADIRTKIAQAESSLHQLARRREELETELNRETLAEQSAQDRLATARSNLDADRTRLEEVESRIEVEQASLAETNASIQQARAELEDSLEERQLADREVDRLQTRFDVLNRLRREGAGYANGVRAVLRASDQGMLPGIVGTVATLLSVPPHLDRAVATALGGAYQNIITRTWSDAQEAIRHLNSTGSGRATFLPLNKLHVLPAIPPPHGPGVLGNASDLVDFDEPVADAVLQLLNRVWIVESLEAARRALDAVAQGPRPTVVTLTGEIVRPGGAVSGGADRRSQDDSILSRERELRKLPEQIDIATAVAEDRATECSRLMRQIELLQQELAPIQKSLQSLGQEALATRELVATREKESERAAQTAHWHATRAEQIGDELTDTAERQSKLRAQMSEASKLLEEAEAHLGKAEEAAESSGASELLEQLADVRTVAAEAQGDLRSQEAILENQQRNLAAAEMQIATRESQIVSLDDESDKLATTIEELGKRERESGAKTASIQSKIIPAEAALEELAREQAVLEQEEREMQRTLRDDEGAWNATQLAMQRAEDRVERLRHDIEQEFGLVFIEEAEDEPLQTPLPWESIVSRLTPLETLPPELDDNVNAMRRRLSRLKNVNPDAPREYAEARERCGFLESQSADLEEAIADLHQVISKLDSLMETELQATYDAVSEQFAHYFKLLFDGGAAQLGLTDLDQITTAGIEIVARPPGKRPQSLALLSGGERTLAACALIFAILRVSPTPFCVLDEVDAALDEANIDRFRFALEELSKDTQFILITHNRRTLEGTNAIYGVTMSSDGTSRVISLKLEGERIVKGGQSSGQAPPENERPANDDDDLREIEETVQL